MNINNYILSDNLCTWGNPKNISLEVTNHCNLNCCHCFRHYYSFPKGYLADELFEKLKPDFLAAESLHLSLSGEPLAAPLFRDWLQWAILKNIPVSFTTNGLLLHRIQDILTEGNISFVLSLDAVSEEGYRKTRGGDFQLLMRNIKMLNFIQQQREDGFPKFSVTCVVWKDNISELPEIIRFAHKYGAENVVCYHRIFYDQKSLHSGSLLYDQKRSDAIMEEAITLSQHLGIHFIHTPLFNGKYSLPEHGGFWLSGTPDDFDCNWITNNTNISFNGLVFACCYTDRLALGNVNHTDLKEIWNGANYRKLRSRITRRQYPYACRNCMFRQVFDVQNPRSFLAPIKENDLFSEQIVPPEPYSLNLLNSAYLTGLAHMENNSFASAEELFHQILTAEPLCNEAMNAIGVIHGINQCTDAAYGYFQKSLEIMPKYQPALSNIQTVKNLMQRE